MKTSWILSAFISLLFLIAALPAFAQEGMPPMGRPAEMDKVEFLLGDWDVTMKMRMSPEAPWVESKGTATTETILDGCVQRMTFEGDVMGMPLVGMDHLSFNRETGQFESFWVDNMSASFSKMSGSLEGDSMVMTGKTMRMGQEMHMRTVSEKVSDDVFEWTMEDSFDGGETWNESMIMTYTRKK